MSGHIDVETVAAFREGLLPARRAARIGAHLSSCPQCAGVDAQLAAVTTLLARSPAPPLPADLAARLDAAIAAESSARSAGLRGGEAAPAPGAGTVATPTPAPATHPGHVHRRGYVHRRGPGRRAYHTQRPPRRWTRAWGSSPLSLRFAAAAAAAVVLLGGGYVIARLGAGAGAGSGTSAAPAVGRAPGHQSAAVRGHQPGSGQAAPGSLRVVSSGTDYWAGMLRAQVSEVLRRYPFAGGAVQPGTSPSTGAPVFPGLSVCVGRITGGHLPVLVDVARYEGRAAVVIVVPVRGSRLVRVWLVGTGCALHPGEVIARFTLAVAG